MSTHRHTLAARSGVAVSLDRGQRCRIINTHGHQVVDTWAFNREDTGEFLSCEHTRAGLLRLMPSAGDALLSNQRRPLVTLVEDTSPGIHDTLMAACDRYRYEQLGCTDYHDNCADNLRRAMRDAGYPVNVVPAPLNLFMNIPWTTDGMLSWDAPRSTPGEYVVLRAETDIVLAMSACPQDMLPVNGDNLSPTSVDYEIF